MSSVARSHEQREKNASARGHRRLGSVITYRFGRGGTLNVDGEVVVSTDLWRFGGTNVLRDFAPVANAIPGSAAHRTTGCQNTCTQPEREGHDLPLEEEEEEEEGHGSMYGKCVHLDGFEQQ